MRNRFKNKWYGKTGKLGFTLVEVLVAIAILAILAVPLAQSMITSAQINSQSKNIGSASDMAQTVAESMQATQLGNVLTEINGYHTDSVGQNLFDTATGDGYSFLNNALQGYSVEGSYEVMLLCPGCNTRLSNDEVEAGKCDNANCSATITDNNIKYVPVTKQNDAGVQSDADVTSSIKTRTTTNNVVRTYFTGNADDTYDFVLKNISTEEANFDVLVHIEPEQTLPIADISSMSSSDLVNIVEKKNLDENVAETFFEAHQLYSTLGGTSSSMTVADFQRQMTRHITIDIRNDAIRGTTVITVKAKYTAPDGTVDVADKYITKTIGSFTTNSTAELADGVYLYYYPLRGNMRDIITVENPDSMGIKVYLILMNDEQTGEYTPALRFGDLTPSSAANTTTFCSNHPEEKFAELPNGVHIQSLSNTTEQQTLYAMDVKVFTHKDSSFDADGVFTPNDKYLIIDTDATLLDSSEKFDINVDSEFGNPIPEEPEGGTPGDDPGDGDEEIGPAPNKGYAEAGGQNFVYSGDEYDVTILGGLPGGDEVGKFVEWSGQTKATDAGVYFAYAKPISGHTWPNGTTGKRQVTWTIARKPASIIETVNAVYDAQEHLGYDPDSTKTNYVSMTGDTAKTDAGYYTIYVTPEPNYSWLDDGSIGTREVTWTISPRPVVLTWKTGDGYDTWQYDGAPHSGQCDVDDNSLPASDRGGKIKPNLRNNRIIEVGKVTAEVTSLNNPNYALPTSNTTHELKVWGAQQATITMKPAENGVISMIYNGKEQTGVEFSNGVAITGQTHAIDAGTYEITATPLPGYAWDEAGEDKAPRDFTWHILQRDVDIVWGERVWDYDGVTHSTTCTITNLLPDTVCDVEISNNFILDAGSKEVQATLTNKNYRIPETTNPEKQPIQTLIVNTLPDATFEMNAPVIYDKQTHTWGSGTHIQITGTLSETEAGKYTVTITPTKNHTWTDGSADPVTKTWEIKNAELSTVAWDNYCYTGDVIIGVTNQFCDWGEGTWQATDKSTYTIQVTPSKNYAWADDPDEVVYTYKPQDRSTRTYTWKIVGNTVVKPDPNKALLNFGDPILTFEYNGQTWSPLISTIDGTLPLTDAVFTKNPYYYVEGVTHAVDASKQDANGNYQPYVATIKLKDKNTSMWSDGTTNDIVIEWYITRRQITLYTIPHDTIANQKPHTWYEANAFESENRSLTGSTAYAKKHDSAPFVLNMVVNPTAQVEDGVVVRADQNRGDIYLTKDKTIKYSFDYKAPIEETTPLAYSHTITFEANLSPNIMNTEVGDYSDDFDPIAKTGHIYNRNTNKKEPISSSNTYLCSQQSNAGVYWYGVTPHIFAGSKEVTKNYEITYQFSYLMIDKDPDVIDPIVIAQNAREYNGKDQNLCIVQKAPSEGTVEFLWEAYTYKAESAWATGGTPTPTLNKNKKSLLPTKDLWPHFNGTGFDGYSVENPSDIQYLQGYIDWDAIQPGDGQTGIVRSDCPYWTSTMPTGAVSSDGTQFSNIGTYAGKYVVYWRFRGDANHYDKWDPSWYLIITVNRTGQVINIVDHDNDTYKHYDRCHNEVPQDIATDMQENPAISYSYDSAYVKKPTWKSYSSISPVKTTHTKSLATRQITTITSNGKIGPSKITLYAAATENYNQKSFDIDATCRDHLKDGLRKSLNHLCSTACEQSGDEDHPKHSNKTFAPTCTVDGNYHYDCLECGDERNDVRPKLGHSWHTSVSGGGDCCTPTTVTTSCSRCKSSSSTTYGAPYGDHSWRNWTTSEHHCVNKLRLISKDVYLILDGNGNLVGIMVVETWQICPAHRAHTSQQTGSGACCGTNSECTTTGCSFESNGAKAHGHAGTYETSTRNRTHTRCSCCKKIMSTTYGAVALY